MQAKTYTESYNKNSENIANFNNFDFHKIRVFDITYKMRPNQKDSAFNSFFGTLVHEIKHQTFKDKWIGYRYIYSPFNSSKQSITPYLQIFNKDYNGFIQPGIQVTSKSISPIFAAERKTQYSHFSFFTRFFNRPNLECFWINNQYGGPVFSYSGIPSLGYKHQFDVIDGFRLSLLTQFNQVDPYYGCSFSLGLDKHEKKTISNSVY